MTELKMEHVLILAIVAFVLYHFVDRCSCNGFRVGGQKLHSSDGEAQGYLTASCNNRCNPNNGCNRNNCLNSIHVNLCQKLDCNN